MATEIKRAIWVRAWIANQQSQSINNWASFNIQPGSNVNLLTDTVAQLPTIVAPATSVSTVYEISCQAIRIKEALSPESTFVTSDHAIYATSV